MRKLSCQAFGNQLCIDPGLWCAATQVDKASHPLQYLGWNLAAGGLVSFARSAPPGSSSITGIQGTWMQ